MKHNVISAEVTVRELAGLLENARVLFVQQNGVLIGSVTNGDFRRGIAAGASLNDRVERIMNRSPLVTRENDNYRTRFDLVSGLPAGFRYLPVVNACDEIVDVVTDKALCRISNWAVLMAGGLGSRLKSLTHQMPKPMLKIGDKPLLQLIIENLRRAGISKFIISVNYKSEVITDYLGDGSELDVEIIYLREKDRMGTAGCLSLLETKPTESFFAMNADILTDVDFHDVLEAHMVSRSMATVCLAEHRVSIPYGVVETEGGQVTAIEEKPAPAYHINAGIYVLDPACLGFVPGAQYFEMTSLLQQLINTGHRLNSYKMGGLWIDIGDVEDLKRANHHYHENLVGML